MVAEVWRGRACARWTRRNYSVLYAKKWNLNRDDLWMTRNSRRQSRINQFQFMSPHVCRYAMIRLIYSARKKHETEHAISAFIVSDDSSRQCHLPGMLLKTTREATTPHPLWLDWKKSTRSVASNTVIINVIAFIPKLDTFKRCDVIKMGTCPYRCLAVMTTQGSPAFLESRRHRMYSIKSCSVMIQQKYGIQKYMIWLLIFM